MYINQFLQLRKIYCYTQDGHVKSRTRLARFEPAAFVLMVRCSTLRPNRYAIDIYFICLTLSVYISDLSLSIYLSIYLYIYIYLFIYLYYLYISIFSHLFRVCIKNELYLCIIMFDEHYGTFKKNLNNVFFRLV